MSVLAGEDTRVVVQGITGHQGRFHTKAMKDYGTKVVAGVTPGKGGTTVEKIPVFDSMDDAVAKTNANSSILFVPAPFALDAAVEAVQAGIQLLVIITERIPVLDTMKIVAYAKARGTIVVGPNCPGVISSEKCKIGIMPGHIFRRGDVGVVSRSGTLTYEIVNEITQAGMGQSTCVGIGGDPVVGMNFNEVLRLLADDEETKKIVIVGEIGGTAEEEAARFVEGIEKEVVAYVAGRTAPPGRRMGHAGAIITRGMGTAESKIRAFEDAGVKVARYPREVADLLRR